MKIRFVVSGIRCWVWQYGLWSFQAGGTKLERFLTPSTSQNEILTGKAEGEGAHGIFVTLSEAIYFSNQQKSDQNQ